MSKHVHSMATWVVLTGTARDELALFLHTRLVQRVCLEWNPLAAKCSLGVRQGYVFFPTALSVKMKSPLLVTLC